MIATAKMPDVVGNIRVSTEEQAKEGISLIEQEMKVTKYCDLHDLHLVEITRDEGVSGKTLARPGIQEALAMLRDGRAGGLVIAKLDRLTRRLKDWTTLIDEYFGEKIIVRGGRGRGLTRDGYKLHSVNDHVNTATPNGRLMLNLVFTIAQWERETISERTRNGLRTKMGMEERVGAVRYGFDLDLTSDMNKRDQPGRLVLNPVEQERIAMMRALRDDGASLRAVCAALEQAGIETKDGRKTWHPDTVRKILKWSCD
jgi:DNA invertase Pin-like site-specific DNA recombinase